ncbi:hypothetical protein TrRE_jg4854, partial [Triparma retinervis]
MFGDSRRVSRSAFLISHGFLPLLMSLALEAKDTKTRNDAVYVTTHFFWDGEKLGRSHALAALSEIARVDDPSIGSRLHSNGAVDQLLGILRRKDNVDPNTKRLVLTIITDIASAKIEDDDEMVEERNRLEFIKINGFAKTWALLKAGRLTHLENKPARDLIDDLEELL